MNKLKTNSKKVLSVFLAVLMCVTVMVVATPGSVAADRACSNCGSAMSIWIENPPKNGQPGTRYWKCSSCGNVEIEEIPALEDNAAPIATITLDGAIVGNENVYLSAGVEKVSLYDVFDYDADGSTTAGSGVNYVKYYLSDKALTEDELKAVADGDWTTICEGTTGGNIITTFSMDYQEGTVTYICLKLADNAGNVRYTISPAIYFDTHVSKTDYAKVDATCSKEGNEAYSVCDTCGKIFDAEGNELDAVPVIAKNDSHNFTGVAVNNNDGTHSFKCKDCGVAVGGTVSCDDTYGERVVVNASRPTAAGQKGKVIQTCSVCSYVKETEVDRADYTEYDVVVDELGAIVNSPDITPEATLQISETVIHLLIAENLVADEQAIVDEATEALKAVLNDIKTNKDKYYKTYTVTFMSEGEILATVTVFSGEAAVYEGEQPKKAADADNHYAFDKWDKEFDCVREDLTVTAEFANEAHKGGVATCIDKAVCDVCQKAYGEVDANNHVGETEVVGAKAANCTEEGYTGDTVCKSCTATIANGEVIAIDANNHVGGTEVVNTKAATCAEEGYTGDTVCKGCKATLANGEAIAIDANNHVGETAVVNTKVATCTEEGYTGDTVCTSCTAVLEKGEAIAVDANNHVGGTEVVNTKAATCAEEGYTGDTVCKGCKATLANGEAIAVDANNHVGETEVVNVKVANCTEEGYTGDTVCKSCGATLTSGEAIPVDSDKHVYTAEWTQVSPADCINAEVLANDCSLCGAHVEKAGQKATGHKFDFTWTIITEETCGSEGVREKVCKNCNGTLEGGKIVQNFKNTAPCFCHRNHVLAKVLRLVLTIFSILFRREIKCCNDMEFFFIDDIGSLT